MLGWGDGERPARRNICALPAGALIKNSKSGLAKVTQQDYALPSFFGNPSWRRRCGSRQENTFDFIMAVKIRMKRVGAKNAPVFRIVVADGRSPRDGKFIEEIGTYQPLKKGDNFKLDLDRAKYWLGKGAQPSETVASFIKKASKAVATATASTAAA